MNAVAPLPFAPLYPQLEALPDNVVGEILNGTLYTQPRPRSRHAVSASRLGMDLGHPFDLGRGGPGGWWIIDEPEIHFVRDTEVAVPDLAGWRREHMPSLPDDHRFEVTPDWVCEILSPSTARKDRVIKLPLYARYGVAFAWLIDPLQRTLEAYALHDQRWLLIATLQDDEAVQLPPFDAVSFPLGDLWV